MINVKCFIASLRERRAHLESRFLSESQGPMDGRQNVPFTRLCQNRYLAQDWKLTNHRDGADESAQLCDEAAELSGDVREVSRGSSLSSICRNHAG